MLLILFVGTLWLAFGSYIIWFFFKAKTVQPLTLDDLALTWKVHKRQKGCNASRIHGLIKGNNEIIGFKCECGYEFVQKRLITQRPQEQNVTPESMEKQLAKA